MVKGILFNVGEHYCRTPRGKKGNGVWICKDKRCRRVFVWKESTRTDRHGRPVKGGGFWQQRTR